jgi:hypothetical protein
VVGASFSSRDLSRPRVIGCAHVMGLSFSYVRELRRCCTPNDSVEYDVSLAKHK